jgi:hypothetical protein
MKVFLCLLIITSLKKHTFFIVATLLKYRECRESLCFLRNNYTTTKSKPKASFVYFDQDFDDTRMPLSSTNDNGY